MASTVVTTRHDQSETTRGWPTVAIVTISGFMLMLDLTVVNVALPRLQAAFSANFSDLQWVIDAYELTLAAFLLPAGSLADRLGRRRVFTVGFLLFAVASLACGLAGGILQLAVARAVEGIGGAVLFAVGPALIGQVVHGKARAAAFGVFGAGTGLAIATGPLIGGALTSGLGWRWIFLINVPIGVASAVLGRAWMRESQVARARRLDWAGLVTSVAGLTGIVFGLLRGGEQGWANPAILACLAGGAVLLVAFVCIQKVIKGGGTLDLALFRIPTFSGLSVIAVLLSAGALAAIFLLVLYVQDVLGLSPWLTGLRFLPMTGALFAMAVVGGVLTAKVPHWLLLAASAFLTAAGLALFGPLVHVDSTWTALLPCTVLLGAGLGLFNPVRAYLAIGVTDPSRAGIASGTSETFQQAGMALGIAAVGAVFQARVISTFTASTAGHALGAAASPVAVQIAAGNLGVARGIPSHAVAVAARSAFFHGLQVSTNVCAVLCAAVLIAVFSIRRRDLHPSAIDAIPGVLPESQSELEPRLPRGTR